MIAVLLYCRVVEWESEIADLERDIGKLQFGQLHRLTDTIIPYSHLIMWTLQ